jgi:aspartyl-tRNA(Asn)/glutamyl-tRNA(Gln) amidotransferase subunit C
MSQAAPAPSGVTLEDVRHVAELANLEPAPEELPRLVNDLNAILGHIAQLSELDTSNVPPMAQVGAAMDAAPAAHGETLRPDVEVPCLDRATVMHQAPESNGVFFKVPKVLDR